MKRSSSIFFVILAVLNLIVAVIPPIAGIVGALGMTRASDIVINGKQVGPEFDKQVAIEAPLAKVEAFGTLGSNVFSALLLVAGSVGIFMGYGWARWVTLAGAVFMLLGLLVHDVYQLFIYRPALMVVFDRVTGPFLNFGFPDNFQRDIVRTTIEGLRWGMTIYTCAWSCINPLFMLYLAIMAACMGLMKGVKETGTAAKDDKKRSKKDDDDDDEDRPSSRRKRSDDDDEEERPSPRRKKRDRDDDDD